MTPDRINEVEDLALTMAGEIEWCRFAGEDDTGGAVTRLVRDPDTVDAVRRIVALAIAAALRNPAVRGDHFGHQEPELEAAGVVQGAIKQAMQLLYGSAPAVAFIRGQRLETKFARLPVPVRQSPPGAWVPSIAQQAAGARPIPPADPFAKGGDRGHDA